MKGKVIRIYFKCSLKGKNAFILYQKKEDRKLDRDHRSIKGRWETLSFGDKKLDWLELITCLTFSPIYFCSCAPPPLHVLPPPLPPFQALATQQQGNFYYCFFRVVFDIHSSDTPQVRASSSKSHNLTDDEKGVLEELQAWSAHKEALNKRFSITNLKELSTTHHFINLLAQVVAISWTEKGDIVLTLWDGSLPACQSVLVDPISEQGQVMSDKLMHKASKCCIDVILYDNHVRSIGTKVCPGDFVCIRNVHVKERTADNSVTAHNRQVICGSKRYNLHNSSIDVTALDSHCRVH